MSEAVTKKLAGSLDKVTNKSRTGTSQDLGLNGQSQGISIQTGVVPVPETQGNEADKGLSLKAKYKNAFDSIDFSNSVNAINDLNNRLRLAENYKLIHAIKIGEILLEEKEKQGHGNFKEWYEKNFKDMKSSTLRLYMYFAKPENKEKLLSQIANSVSSIRDARRFLTEEKQDNNKSEKKTKKPSLEERYNRSFSQSLSRIENKFKVKLSDKARKKLESQFEKLFLEAIEEQAKGKTVK
ncbi:MAG: hypothetical protein KDK45_19630 [Leptospiraceae bacterium]|nr:hypothetical protein [Leptospiraceae bacterium]